ncbi:MAG: DUF4403 family protein [Myxococcaceae bacterium]|nr:DUF4403 family protein [Myxococcaceae bacterium]
MKRVLVALVVSGCATTMPLYPSRPASAVGAPPADPLPAKLVVHLTATADGLKRALDTKVPASGETTVELKGPRPVRWSRAPFTLRFADGRVELKTELSLETELPVLGKTTVPVSVAVTGEPIITSDWKARLQGATSKLESKDLRLRTMQGVAGVLEKAQDALDGFIENFSWDLSPQLTRAWERVSTPIPFPVGDASACAQLRVTSIEAGPTVVAGGLEKDVAFVVAPSVSLPCPSDAPRAELPRLANVATLPSGPFTVEVPIAARYEELAKAMSATFTDGKLYFSKSYPELYLSDPEVFATKDEQLVVKLHLAGPIKAAGFSATLDGDLFFAGHPQVVDNVLRVPDLEPTVQTTSFLLGLKATLDANGIRDQARAALTLDLGERFRAVRERLSTDTPFDENLGCARTNVSKIAVTGVYPHAAYLRVYLSLTAQGSVYLPCPGSSDAVAAAP